MNDESKVTFLGQEKLILGHNEINYGTNRVTFLGQEKLILSHNETNYGTRRGDVWDKRS